MMQNKRVFPIDSRSGWIEQHHIGAGMDGGGGAIFCVQKSDSFAVGPQDYSPTILERHAPSPRLGSAGIVLKHSHSTDRFKFPNASVVERSGDANYNNKTDGDCISEYRTIFHDQDRRQPIDPTKRFCTTPGPYLTQDSILEGRSVCGKTSVGKLLFGQAKRFDTDNRESLALTYDVAYDSLQLKPKVTLGFCPSTARMPIQFGQRSAEYTLDSKVCPRSQTINSDIKSSFQTKASMVRIPIVRQKFHQEFHFDASCYRDAKQDSHVDISPGQINKLVTKNKFGHFMTVQKYHTIRSK